MTSLEPGSAARVEQLQRVVADLGAVSVCHMRRLESGGVVFGQVQALLIGALMQELARVIACGPPPVHRKHVQVVLEEMPRLVAASAVAMGPFGDDGEERGA